MTNEEKKKSRIEKAVDIKSRFDKNCIIHQSLQLIGNKWTLLVIMSLIKEKKRTHQIQEEVIGISSKVLSQTLKKLLSFKIVTKKIYPVVPPKVEYSLTEFGKTLINPLDSLFIWSLENETTIRDLYEKNSKKKSAD
ncbi:helix-turn-helix domain-containing protein [Aquimarina gracilis]|uniref:Helix-turn-helix domain-containing protein n=1 Tax=Aquimarina gracilis TaxID=874422 RepID=A0ABU6A0M6_9FLAO|nr:helix-turn-helix domain-containing protein [Aquimarina gracilis]MEB3347610.1 helix-turn-helix domain-containing protein [Aquimarina gracilis]